MNSLAILCVFGLTLVETILYPRESIHILGQEYCEFAEETCPNGTYCYETACGVITPEPTCDDLNPKTIREKDICGHVFTACYCNPPTVRDLESDKCIPLEECPK